MVEEASDIALDAESEDNPNANKAGEYSSDKTIINHSACLQADSGDCD